MTFARSSKTCLSAAIALEQQAFAPPAIDRTNDCLVSGSVSTSAATVSNC
jgi:hypothetical protein